MSWKVRACSVAGSVRRADVSAWRGAAGEAGGPGSRVRMRRMSAAANELGVRRGGVEHVGERLTDQARPAAAGTAARGAIEPAAAYR